MFRWLFNAITGAKPVDRAQQRAADIHEMAQTFAFHIQHAGMSQTEHAQILEAWFVDPKDGNEHIRIYAAILSDEFKFQHGAAHGIRTPSPLINPIPTHDYETGKPMTYRGPTFRDRKGNFIVSTDPFPLITIEETTTEIANFNKLCARLDVNLYIGAEDKHSEARRVTEEMMITLRRHGPNSHYVRRL